MIAYRKPPYIAKDMIDVSSMFFFDGVDDYAFSGKKNLNLTQNDDFSISFFIRFSNSGIPIALVPNDSGIAAPNSIHIEIIDAGGGNYRPEIIIHLDPVGTESFISSDVTSLKPNVIQHCALCYDGSTKKINFYINGIYYPFAGNLIGNFSLISTGFMFGKAGISNFCNCLLGHVSLFNKNLSVAEIKALKRWAGYIPTSLRQNLLSYYPLNENFGAKTNLLISENNSSTTNVNQIGHGFSVGDWIRFDGLNFVFGDFANPGDRLVSNVIGIDDFTYALEGNVNIPSHGIGVDGDIFYMDNSGISGNVSLEITDHKAYQIIDSNNIKVASIRKQTVFDSVELYNKEKSTSIKNKHCQVMGKTDDEFGANQNSFIESYHEFYKLSQNKHWSATDQRWQGGNVSTDVDITYLRNATLLNTQSKNNIFQLDFGLGIWVFIDEDFDFAASNNIKADLFYIIDSGDTSNLVSLSLDENKTLFFQVSDGINTVTGSLGGVTVQVGRWYFIAVFLEYSTDSIFKYAISDNLIDFKKATQIIPAISSLSVSSMDDVKLFSRGSDVTRYNYTITRDAFIFNKKIGDNDLKKIVKDFPSAVDLHHHFSLNNNLSTINQDVTIYGASTVQDTVTWQNLGSHPTFKLSEELTVNKKSNITPCTKALRLGGGSGSYMVSRNNVDFDISNGVTYMISFRLTELSVSTLKLFMFWEQAGNGINMGFNNLGTERIQQVIQTTGIDFFEKDLSDYLSNYITIFITVNEKRGSDYYNTTYINGDSILMTDSSPNILTNKDAPLELFGSAFGSNTKVEFVRFAAWKKILSKKVLSNQGSNIFNDPILIDQNLMQIYINANEKNAYDDVGEVHYRNLAKSSQVEGGSPAIWDFTVKNYANKATLVNNLFEIKNSL